MSVIIKQHCRNRTVYHTELCQNAKLITEKRVVDMELAQRMDLDHCEHCQTKRGVDK